MQELEKIHAGASTYTFSSLGSWRNFVFYMSNFNVVVFQLDPLRYYATITGPADLPNSESSGLLSIAVNRSGKLAMISRRGMLQVYYLPNVHQVAFYVSLDHGKKNTDLPADDRRATHIYFSYLMFHPKYYDVVCALDEYNKQCTFYNIQSYRAFVVDVPDRINAVGIFHSVERDLDCCFMGSALTGKLLFINEFEKKLKAFFEGTGDKSDVTFSYLEVGSDQYELELSMPVAHDQITMTGFIYAHNINFSTVLSISEDTMAQGITHNVASVWYGGYITVHDMLNIKTEKRAGDTCQLTGRRCIRYAKCACFLADNPGILAVGLASGVVYLVNVSSISMQNKVEYIDYGPFFGHSADYINKSLSNAMNNEQTLVAFYPDEVISEIPISRGNPIIALRSFAFEGFYDRKNNFQGAMYYGVSNTSTASDFTYTMTPAQSGRSARKIVLFGSCTDGSFFVYDYTYRQIIVHTYPNHSESIFSICVHPTLPNLYASISADSTVKVWRDTPAGLLCDQQFGQIGASIEHQSRVYGGGYGSKGGGAINSFRLVGPLLSGAWDPRDQACYMMVGSFRGSISVVDVWRGTVFASYPPHRYKVLDIYWAGGSNSALKTQNNPCMAVSVSADGTGRLYLFDRNIDLSSSSSQFELNQNFIYFMDHECSLNGVAFSYFDDILAVACGDGYVRVFETSIFRMEKEYALNYLAEHKIDSAFLYPIQIGKFSVSDRYCHKIAFSSINRNVFAVACDGGEVKVFRYEYNGMHAFKIQTTATLLGFKNNARPVVFHPELPYLVVAGSWDGTVRAWNWVTSKEVCCFQLDSDVYGLGILPTRPFEIVVGSRDLTIRKLYFKEIAYSIGHELIYRALLTSVLNFPSGYMSNQDLKSQFNAKACCPYACDCLLQEYYRLLQKPAYKSMKEEFEKNTKYKLLSGQYSAKLSQEIEQASASNKSNILFVLGKIIGFFYPQDSGAGQLLNALSFYTVDDFDFYVSDHIKDEQFALSEYEMTSGLSLTGRALHYFADCLGRHYAQALTKQDMQVPDRFKQYRFSFYNFHRKVPNYKADAYRYYFATSATLLAGAYNIDSLVSVLKFAQCSDLLPYCAVFDPEVAETAFLPEDPNSLSSRLGLATSLAPLFCRYIEGYLIMHFGENMELLQTLCATLCSQREFALAKLNAHCMRSTDMVIDVAWESALQSIKDRRVVRAAMELLSVKQVEASTRVLALGGEPFLAALFAMTVPEETSRLGLYGMAEIAYMNGIEPGTLLKIGRGSSVSSARVDELLLAKWFTFDGVIKYYSFMCRYLDVFRANQAEQIDLNPAYLLQITSIAQFFDAVLECMEPHKLLFLMGQHTGSVGQRYNAANLYLMDCVNQYVLGYIKQKQTLKSFQMCSGIETYSVELGTLYNLFRHKALDPKHNVCRLGAFLSNYIGGMAANQLNLFYTAAFMFSYAEKIGYKCDFVYKEVDLETVRLRKLLAVFGYQGDAARPRLQQFCQASKQYTDFDCDYFLRIVVNSGGKYENERERLVFQAIGSNEMRCVFSPFGLSMQPTLMLCGGAGGVGGTYKE